MEQHRSVHKVKSLFATFVIRGTVEADQEGDEITGNCTNSVWWRSFHRFDGLSTDLPGHCGKLAGQVLKGIQEFTGGLAETLTRQDAAG